jgi:hypothetical protein
MINNRQIKLDFDIYSYEYCTFTLDGNLILYCNYDENAAIIIYSTQTKNNKWKCKRMYEIPKDYSMLSISKYDKLYLFSNNSIYEWNLITEKSIKILSIDEKIKYDDNDDKVIN